MVEYRVSERHSKNNGKIYYESKVTLSVITANMDFDRTAPVRKRLTHNKTYTWLPVMADLSLIISPYGRNRHSLLSSDIHFYENNYCNLFFR